MKIWQSTNLDHQLRKNLRVDALLRQSYWANGQVEAMNRTVIGLIKKHNQKQNNWLSTMDQVLLDVGNSPS